VDVERFGMLMERMVGVVDLDPRQSDSSLRLRQQGIIAHQACTIKTQPKLISKTLLQPSIT